MLQNKYAPGASSSSYGRAVAPAERWIDSGTGLVCQIRQHGEFVFTISVRLPGILGISKAKRAERPQKLWAKKTLRIKMWWEQPGTKEFQRVDCNFVKKYGNHWWVGYAFSTKLDSQEDPTQVRIFTLEQAKYEIQAVLAIAKRLVDQKERPKETTSGTPIWLASAVQCSRKVYLEAVGYTPKGRTKPLVGKQLVQVALSSQDNGFLTSRKIGVELRVPGSENNWAAVIKLKNQKRELDIKTNSLVVEAGGQKLRIYLEF